MIGLSLNNEMSAKQTYGITNILKLTKHILAFFVFEHDFLNFFLKFIQADNLIVALEEEN